MTPDEQLRAAIAAGDLEGYAAAKVRQIDERAAVFGGGLRLM